MKINDSSPEHSPEKSSGMKQYFVSPVKLQNRANIGLKIKSSESKKSEVLSSLLNSQTLVMKRK
jgi:hypothetical protein